MTKKDVKDLYLRYLDYATIKGQALPERITLDFVDKFEHLINGAVQYIASILKLTGEMIIDQSSGAGDKRGDYYSYDLPQSYKKPCSLIDCKTGKRLPGDYFYVSGKKIYISDRLSGDFELVYYRYPTRILPKGAETTVIDLPDNAAHLAALKCAADAVVAENSALAAYYTGLFNSQMQNILDNGYDNAANIDTVYAG